MEEDRSVGESRQGEKRKGINEWNRDRTVGESRNGGRKCGNNEWNGTGL
jgi:hypothetical protein